LSIVYDWEFIPVAGGSFRDSGRGACVITGADGFDETSGFEWPTIGFSRPDRPRIPRKR
jgi:hypothetical protein